jgi:hypothetical protein
MLAAHKNITGAYGVNDDMASTTTWRSARPASRSEEHVQQGSIWGLDGYLRRADR